MQIPTNPFYDIDEHGAVRLISTGQVIPEYRNHKGRRAVKIRGKSHKPASNPLDRLMLVTFKPLPPEKDHEWMSVKFLDGNKDNVSIDNLEWDDTWYYPSQLPGINVSLESWVPAYNHPQIELKLSEKTVIIRNTRTHEEIGYVLDVGGYCLIRCPGYQNRIPLHRIVALTFLPHPIDTDHLTVNHKDSDKTNNFPYNLEWATYSENNFHAYDKGHRGQVIRKIVALNLITKEERIFSGYNDLARYLGVLPGSVHSVLDRRSFEGRPYRDHILKYADDPRTWEKLKSSGPRKKRIAPKYIACRNMDSGKVSVYSSLKDVERYEGINSHALFRLLSLDVMVPWKRKCFQSFVEGKKLIWPEYPPEILKVYEQVHSSDRPVKIISDKGGVEYYPNLSTWCKEDRINRCDPAVISRYLKNSQDKEFRWRDWVFSYIDLSEYLQKSSN